MRVGLVVRRLSPHGGTERFTLGFARALAAAGHDVTAFCRGADVAVAGVAVAPLGGWAGRGRVLKAALLERAAARVPRGSVDVLLGFLRAPGFDVLRAGGGAHAAFLQGRRPGLADRRELARDARALASAGTVVFNSEMARRDALSHHPLDPERLHVVRNGVDLQRFRPNPSSPPEDRILFIGHGWTRKGLETALSALARLPRVRLGVVGRDPNEARFRRRAAALGVAERVDWLGPVDRVDALLPRALALVLPTRYDPSANVCLEAMACGVPVVTSGRDGAGEILPEPWQVVARPDDAEGFAGALDRVLQTPSLRSASRAAAEAWPETRAHRALAHLAGVPLP
jgi:UDP-glucose:(heptosyl)LPS alpha-1,3-glucosyltransferase